MKKIDVFFNGSYLHSTTWYSSCKQAKQAFITRLQDSIKQGNRRYSSKELELMQAILNNPTKIKAYFDKEARL